MALGFARRTIDVDGIRWVYAEGGSRDADAPVLVMPHGFTGSKENWYRVAKRLRGRCRLLIPDLPGWGESQREGVAGHGFATQAARVAAAIRATCDGPDRTSVVSGKSVTVRVALGGSRRLKNKN